MAKTPPPGIDPSRFSDDQVDWIVVNRAAIEQAEGIPTFAREVTADHAFQLLRLQARTPQVKLRLFAQQFVNDVC